MRFKIVIRPDLEDGGFNVSCPALQGCHSQGETEEEAINNIQEAIEGCRVKPSMNVRGFALQMKSCKYLESLVI